MNFGRLAERAKQLVGRRGGSESLKEDAQELRDIARGEGSLSDKAKEAVEAVKEPGRPQAGEPGPSGAGEPERRDEPGPGPAGEPPRPSEPGPGAAEPPRPEEPGPGQPGPR